MTTWLFKPFERVAGGAALAAGLAVLLLTALACWQFGVHADGVLDLHFGPDMALWGFVVQNLVNWLCLVAALWVAGNWLSTTRYRLVDLLGTQALARWPYLPAVFLMGIPPYRRAIENLAASLGEAASQDPGQIVVDPAFLGDAMIVMALSMPVLLMVIWMVWLMYHGFALVFNLKGARAVLSFAGALLAAEIISKVIHIWMLR